MIYGRLKLLAFLLASEQNSFRKVNAQGIYVVPTQTLPCCRLSIIAQSSLFGNIFCYEYIIKSHKWAQALRKCMRIYFGKIDGWMAGYLKSFSTVYRSYQYVERMIIKGCVH